MTRKGEHMMHEADIGSGEKNPADAETQKMIEQIPGLELNGTVPADQASKERPSQENTR